MFNGNRRGGPGGMWPHRNLGQQGRAEMSRYSGPDARPAGDRGVQALRNMLSRSRGISAQGSGYQPPVGVAEQSGANPMLPPTGPTYGGFPKDTINFPPPNVYPPQVGANFRPPGNGWNPNNTIAPATGPDPMPGSAPGMPQPMTRPLPYRPPQGDRPGFGPIPYNPQFGSNTPEPPNRVGPVLSRPVQSGQLQPNQGVDALRRMLAAGQRLYPAAG